MTFFLSLSCYFFYKSFNKVTWTLGLNLLIHKVIWTLDIRHKSFNRVIWTLGMSHYIGSFGLLDSSLFKLGQVMDRARPFTNLFDWSSWIFDWPIWSTQLDLWPTCLTDPVDHWLWSLTEKKNCTFKIQYFNIN